MRCSICDWTPDNAKSDYHKGLYETKSHTRRMVLDNRTNDTICSVCALMISVDLAREVGSND